MTKTHGKQDSTQFRIVTFLVDNDSIGAVEDIVSNLKGASGFATVILLLNAFDNLAERIKHMQDKTRQRVRSLETTVALIHDEIYLVRISSFPKIEDDLLTLTPLQNVDCAGVNAINSYLLSVAETVLDGAAVVVSSDQRCQNSLMAIHEVGGLVIKLSPDDVDGAGEASIAEPFDYHLGSRQISKRLDLWASKHWNTPDDESDGVGLKKILGLLERRYGVNFIDYKPSATRRRIERRAERLRMTLDDYASYLETHTQEIGFLYGQTLTGVTQFFRDEEAFRAFEHLAPPKVLDGKKDGDEVKVWIAACSTGEEVYSIAIVLYDFIERNNLNVQLKIFATDVDEEALAKASEGLYANDLLVNVPEKYLKRFFLEVGNKKRIVPDIRKCIIFAKHNLLVDPPFTKMDLVSCRNMLFFLNREAQKTVVSILHYSVRSHGVLFLGSCESLGKFQVAYRELGKNFKIFHKTDEHLLGEEQRAVLRKTLSARLFLGEKLNLPSSKQLQRKNEYEVALKALQERYIPTSLLVNERLEVLHIFGDAGKILIPRPGRLQLNLNGLIDEKTATIAKVTLQRAKRENKRFAYKGFQIAGQSDSFNLIIEPLSSVEGGPFFLITFEKEALSKPKKSKTIRANDDGMAHVAFLEIQLKNTQENLQVTIEELQTTNEELQNANEELLAANEELQNTNEELHAVNEELLAVNTEHQKKIDELIQLASDEQSLLKATEIGILFLDENLKVRKFTESLVGPFKIYDQLVGRSFEEMASNFVDGSLLNNIRQVQFTGQTVEKEITGRDGKTYLVRLLPSVNARTGNGVVLTFLDVMPLKAVQTELDRKNRLFKEQCQAALSMAQDAELARYHLAQRTEELKQSNAELERYAYVTSHDLQAPLRHMNSFTHILAERLQDSPDEEIQECLKGILSGSQRMQMMIKDLLALSRIGREKLDIVEIDVVQRVKLLKQMLGERIAATQAEVKCGSPCRVFADNSLFDQLLQNIVENALKFVANDVVPIIEVGCQEDANQSLLWVKDNGIGIDAGSLGRIFDIFLRLHPREKYSGTGIGLAICKRIVSLHGGKIWAESEIGKGTTVYMTFNIPPSIEVGNLEQGKVQHLIQ